MTLTEQAWQALEAAEKPLYGTQEFGYTEVNIREESGGTHVAAMWAHAEDCFSGMADGYPTEQMLRDEIARRVAYANAILVFGTEFVGIPEGR